MIVKNLLVACGLATASFFALGAVQQQEDDASQESPGTLRKRITTYNSSPTDDSLRVRPIKMQETRTIQHLIPTQEQREMDSKVAEAAKANTMSI